jgi:excisionase family DNA binding protein
MGTFNMSGFPQSEWLTAREAAAYLRAKPRTLLLWTRPGRIKGYRLSGTKRYVWRFKREDLDAAFTAPMPRCDRAAFVIGWPCSNGRQYGKGTASQRRKCSLR